MVKDNINKNFENLKVEMMRKKEAAKKIENKAIIDNINKNKNVNENKNVNIYDSDTDTGITQNKIVIKKTKKPQPPKRTTYYLNNDTIKKIDKYSKLTGMGKSELVQTLLDVALNNLEIEN